MGDVVVSDRLVRGRQDVETREGLRLGDGTCRRHPAATGARGRAQSGTEKVTASGGDDVTSLGALLARIRAKVTPRLHANVANPPPANRGRPETAEASNERDERSPGALAGSPARRRRGEHPEAEEHLQPERSLTCRRGSSLTSLAPSRGNSSAARRILWQSRRR